MIRPRLNPLLSAAALGLAVPLAGCGAFSTVSTYEDALSAFEQGQFRIANAHLVNVLEEGEVDDRVRLLQVALMLTIGDGNRAMAAIEQLPESVLGGADRRISIAHAQVMQGSPEKTAKIYEELSLDEMTEQDHRMYLWALRDLSEIKQFERGMDVALQRFPASPHLNALAADQLFDERRARDAALYATRALESGPDVLEAQLVAGRKAIFAGDLEGAIGHYSNANEINPMNALPLTNVVGLQLDLGQVDEAGETLNVALENHGGFPFLQWQLARYKLAKDDPQGAREAKERVAREFADNPEFLLMSAEIEAAFGNKRLALDNYRRFVKKVGEVPEIMKRIAELEG